MRSFLTCSKRMAPSQAALLSQRCQHEALGKASLNSKASSCVQKWLSLLYLCTLCHCQHSTDDWVLAKYKTLVRNQCKLHVKYLFHRWGPIWETVGPILCSAFHLSQELNATNEHFFNWKRTLFKISSELACLTHARTAIQQAEN